MGSEVREAIAIFSRIKKRIPRTGCALALAVLALDAGSACAQTAPSKMALHFDPAATTIRWTLKDLLHTVHGTFRLKDGLVTLDETTGVAEGEIIVETASGESGNGARDGRMQKDVLESAKYPEAIFHPQKVTGIVRDGQTQNVTVEGTFTIHGVDHPLFLQVKTTLNGNVLIAKTNFIVPYVAWGMKDPSTLMLRVGKTVQVDVDARATLQ
jgi:polyisoprenoid-binding protein YceI